MKFLNIAVLFFMLVLPITTTASVVVGDSLSQGIGQHLTTPSYSKVGIGIDKFTTSLLPKIPNGNGTVYVSIGTNDFYRGYSVTSYDNKLKIIENKLVLKGYDKVCYLIPPVMVNRVEQGLTNIRLSIKMQKCTYQLPNTNRAHDGVHYTPKGYKSIANALRG